MFSKIKLKLAVRVYELSGRKYGQKLYSPQCLQGKVGIVGVPFGKGQKQKGKVEAGLKAAPIILRKTRFINTLECLGLEVSDRGDVCYEPNCEFSLYNMRNLDHVAPCCKAVADSVYSVLEDEKRCLVLGGDHSVSVGSIYAHMNIAGPSNVALVYVDAHPDLNTNLTSPSGNIHGMTVALLADGMESDWGEVEIPGLDWMSSRMPLTNVAYLGLRSVDSGEAKFLKSKNIAAYSMEEIDKVGISKALSRSLSKIDPSCCKSIHLSFDIDALDYFEAPCTTVPVRGGLTLREGIEIAETLHKTGRLAVVDLVEGTHKLEDYWNKCIEVEGDYTEKENNFHQSVFHFHSATLLNNLVNPAIGTEEQKQVTLEAARNLLIAFFGYLRGGNVFRENT